MQKANRYFLCPPLGYNPFVIVFDLCCDIFSGMHAFVTIGSTRFDTLVQAVFTEDVLSSLCRKGYTRLVVQCGNSTFELASTIKNGNTHKMNRAGVDIEFWSYKPSLQGDYEKADLVISHAGRVLLLYG
jgi:beta-1,4-N-acetylglucosaminyltransferase